MEEGYRRCVPWEVFEAALKDRGEKDADGCAEDGPVNAKDRYQLLSPHPRIFTSTVAADHRGHKQRGLIRAYSVSVNEAQPGVDKVVVVRRQRRVMLEGGMVVVVQFWYSSGSNWCGRAILGSSDRQFT